MDNPYSRKWCRQMMLSKKRLNELKIFLDEAEEGLATPLVKGDYDALVKIITYLKKVRDRQAETDVMFEPLVAIMRVLKQYDMDFPERVYLMLQELPERWANMKKNSVTTKTTAQPLIAAESANIRRRVVLFDIRQSTYKENFKHKCFFQWSCTDPYREIDKASIEMIEMENTLNKLTEQAALFEINKPDGKALINARKELRMAKLVWDYIQVIKGWMQNWRETLWKNIDSEAMDMELKKFTKELRTLDKDMRNWEIFLRLESEIKNMIAALKAVTELQNPAIRERHWEELIAVTGVRFRIVDNTTLDDLLQLELYRFEDEVKNIVDKSVKEQQMEKTLKDFDKVGFEHK
uniref:Dynein beta chain, ciliary n=1 Tax=Cacopsylla melanoneura TaxID=428564 RepID=A0A8D9F8A8_9HEMI